MGSLMNIELIVNLITIILLKSFEELINTAEQFLIKNL